MSDLLAMATQVSKEDLAALSNAELVAFVDLVAAETGEEILKENDRERALEAQMSEDLDEEYVEGVDEALEAELVLHPEEMTADEAGLVVRGVGDRLEDDLAGDRGVRMSDVLAGGIGASILMGRSAGIAALGAAGVPTAGISGSLSLVDRAAIEALSGQQLFWIGRLWNDHLSKTISATIQREALDRGLSRNVVGGIVRGVVRGTVPGVAVPETWRGSSENYFKMLAGTVRNQASNFGALETFDEAGIKRYQIMAVLDERTSKICQMMHGRTFEVKAGMKNATARMEAADPEAARAAAPWISPDAAQNLPGFDESPEEALTRAGVMVPPFHGSCRTTVVPA